MKRVIGNMTVLLVVGAIMVFVGGADAATDKPFAGTTIRIIAEAQNPTLAMEKQLPKFEELTGIKNLGEVFSDSIHYIGN